MTLMRGPRRFLGLLGFLTLLALNSTPLFSQTDARWNTVQSEPDALTPDEMNQIYDSLRRLANRELERFKNEAGTPFEDLSDTRNLRAEIQQQEAAKNIVYQESIERFESNGSRAQYVLDETQAAEISARDKMIRKLERQIERLRHLHGRSARDRFLDAVREHRIFVSVVKRQGKLIYTSGRPTLDESGQYPASYFLDGIEGNFLSNAIQDRFELVLIGSSIAGEELVLIKHAPREDFRADFDQPLPRKLHSQTRKRILRGDIPLEINRRKDGTFRSLSQSWDSYWITLKKFIDRINVYTDADVLVVKDSIVNPLNPEERVTEAINVVSVLRGQNIFEKTRKIANAVMEKPSWRKAFQSLVSAGGQAVIAASVFHLFHPEASDIQLSMTAATTFTYAWTLGTFSKSYDRICRLPGHYFGEVGIRMITHIPLLIVKSVLLGGWVVLASPRVYLSSTVISLVDKVGSTISSIIPRQREKYGLNEGRYLGLFDKTFTQRELISAWPRMLLADAALLFTNTAGEASSLGKLIQALSAVPYFLVDLMHLRGMERRFPHRAADLAEDRIKLLSLVDIPALIMRAEQVVDRMRGIKSTNPLAAHRKARCEAIMSRLEGAKAISPPSPLNDAKL